MTITELAKQVNEAAKDYRVGGIQEFRRELGRNPGTRKFFTGSTIKDRYAFHYGGRKQLQFNIGFERRPDAPRCWRHGVAFSFERSQSLPDPLAALGDKVLRFNKWVTSNEESLGGFRMWTWSKDGKREHVTEDRSPGQILEGDLKSQAFVFLGTRVEESEVDERMILRDFDRLYQLYQFVERDVLGPTPSAPSANPEAKLIRATALHSAAEVEVDLRERLLQGQLIGLLRTEFPGCEITEEWKINQGDRDARVDVVIETGAGPIFCEIKIASDVRAALRKAVGQLLEYAHWPDETRARKLWIMSEEAPTGEDAALSPASEISLSATGLL